jgi:hypothetical protein
MLHSIAAFLKGSQCLHNQGQGVQAEARKEIFLLVLLYHEDEDTRILRNVSTITSTRRHIPEDINLQQDRRENLKCRWHKESESMQWLLLYQTEK